MCDCQFSWDLEVMSFALMIASVDMGCLHFGRLLLIGVSAVMLVLWRDAGPRRFPALFLLIPHWPSSFCSRDWATLFSRVGWTFRTPRRLSRGSSFSGARRLPPSRLALLPYAVGRVLSGPFFRRCPALGLLISFGGPMKSSSGLVGGTLFS